MKRAFYFLMLCGAIAASACKSEQLPESPSVPENDGRTYLTVTVEPTKASVDGSGAFSWTVGDQISVYTTAGSFVAFTCDRVEDGRAVFSSEGDVTVDKVAVFPAGSHTLSGNALSVNLPDTYAWEEGQTFAPLVASFTKDAEEISFRHIGGVMQFTVTDLPVTARQFVFRSADKQVSGSFTLSDYADEIGTIAAGTATEGITVTVTFDAPATTGTSKVFFRQVRTAIFPSSFWMRPATWSRIPPLRPAAARTPSHAGPSCRCRRWPVRSMWSRRCWAGLMSRPTTTEQPLRPESLPSPASAGPPTAASGSQTATVCYGMPMRTSM